MSYANLADIVGCIPTGMTVSDDRQQLTLDLADGRKAVFTVYGDCCSRSFIEHTSEPWQWGHPITEVKDGGQVGNWWRDDQAERVQVYQTSFVTPYGEIVVEYRNESNGYYGGWMEGPTFLDAPRPGVKS
jgi:hypothetical protein